MSLDRPEDKLIAATTLINKLKNNQPDPGLIQQLDACDKAAIDLVNEMDAAIQAYFPDDMAQYNKSVSAISKKAMENKKQADSVAKKFNELDKNHPLLIKENKDLLKTIEDDPIFSQQYHAIRDLEQQFNEAKGRSEEARKKNNAMVSVIGVLKEAKSRYDNIKVSSNYPRLNAGSEIENLIDKYNTLVSNDETLNKAMETEKDSSLQEVIDKKLKNNKELAEVIAELKARSKEGMEDSGRVISFLQKEKTRARMDSDTYKKQTNDNINLYLGPLQDTPFGKTVADMGKHFTKRLAINFTEHDEKIKDELDRVVFYRDYLNQLEKTLENENIVLVESKKVIVIKDEISAFNKQFDQCIAKIEENSKNLSLPPCERLETGQQMANELNKQREALQNKILTQSSEMKGLTSLSENDKKAMLAQLDGFSTSLTDTEQLSKLESQLAKAERTLDDTYRETENQSFLGKKFGDVNYKLLIALREHILNCDPMKDLLKQNHKKGSLKAGLVDTYEKQIREATTLDQLYAAVLDNPKDPNGKLDPRGKLLTLRGNTGFTSIFNVNSTSDNLMKKLHKELDTKVDDQVKLMARETIKLK